MVLLNGITIVTMIVPWLLHRPLVGQPVAMFRQEQRVWMGKPSLRDHSISDLEASLLAVEQQNKEMANLKHDLVSPEPINLVKLGEKRNG